MRSRTIALAVGLVLAGAAPAWAADPITVTAPDGAVYRATASELAHWIDIARRGGVRRGARRQAFQLLVHHAWIRAEAAERGIVVPWERVVREFRRQRDSSFSTRRGYRRFLRNSGQTTDDILFRLHSDMLSDRIRAQVVEPAAASVTEADIDAYLAEFNEQRTPERRDIRIVLTADRAAALAAKRELLSGATWSSVARRYSIDEPTREHNGLLPDVARGTLERRLDRAVFRARPRRVAGPIRTQFGYYVFRVTRIHPSRAVPDAVLRRTARAVLISRAQEEALMEFVEAFDLRWQARTACTPAWRSQPECGAG